MSNVMGPLDIVKLFAAFLASVLLHHLLCITPTSGSPESSVSYLCVTPGQCFLEYHPKWTSPKQLGIQFSFRTLKVNTFLLHHTFYEGVSTAGPDGIAVAAAGGAGGGGGGGGGGGRGGDASGRAANKGHPFQRHSPELWITLKKGVLKVTHSYKDLKETLNIAKGLSHDHWHKVTVTIDTVTGHLTAEVDNRGSHSRVLQAFGEKAVSRAYGPGRRTSIVSVAGFSPESLIQGTNYIGCIKGVRFLEGTRVIPTPVFDKGGVEKGCMNTCEVDSPCIHGGKCVNHYTHTRCDCYGTGYEGNSCEKEGFTAVTLQGAEWINYNVYQNEDRTHSPASRIALEFKTSAPEGILFYAREQYPQYNHLALSLHNSSLHVSVVFEDKESHNELFITVGKHLSENRWHTVLVTHQGREVTVTLDQETERMSADYNHPHLHMPTTVYFGGTEVSAQTLGLRSNKTFIGCLQAIYFNHESVLTDLGSQRAHYHGDTPLQYGCQDMMTTAIQFPHSGAFIKVEHPQNEQLEIELEFRTLKPDALLIQTEILIGSYKGHFKLALHQGSIELRVISAKYREELQDCVHVGEHLNNNEWNTLRLVFHNEMLEVMVNGQSQTLTINNRYITIGAATYLGVAPDTTDLMFGYVGCMRTIRIQGQDMDPVRTLHSQLGVGITLGACHLVDRCRDGNNPCWHGGQCVAQWTDTHCDCSAVDFVGKFCQFSTLKHTCDEYYLSGDKRTGVYLVDFDGAGRLKPVHVYCEMGAEVDGRKYGLTRVEHNLKPQTLIRDPSLVDMKKMLSYREMTGDLLKLLVQQSAHCRQHIIINCLGAPLGLGKKTSFYSAADQRFSSVGGDVEGACGCYEQFNCQDSNHKCNCDQLSSKLWLRDGGYISKKEHLPIMQMTFLQDLGGQANITLGPLECYGQAAHTEDTMVTFLSHQSYLAVDGWQGTDLEFLFRTSDSDALILYQPGNNQSAPQLVVTITKDNSLTISIGRPELQITVETAVSLSNGKWQQVKLTVYKGQLRVQVTDQERVVDLPARANLGPHKGAVSPLYIGGASRGTGAGQVLPPGVMGCVGGLVINGHKQPLSHLVKEKEGIETGCQSHCQSEPCLNGGVCTEHWTTYTCQCRNYFAHLGNNCQTNINTDAVKFMSSDSFLVFTRPSTPGLLNKNIVFSFRTYQQRALLFYVHDHLSNFLQVEVVDEAVLLLSFNDGNEIIRENITVPDLTDGVWKQVAILPKMDVVRVIVEGTSQVIHHNRRRLQSYQQSPFMDADTVRLRRGPTSPAREAASVFVGGVVQSYSDIPGLQGCFRGLMIGDRMLSLTGPLQGNDGGHSGNIRAGCRSDCESGPCQHQGHCVDHLDSAGHYTCDCIDTGYSGTYCNTEVGAYFDGEAILQENLRTKVTTSQGSFRFTLDLHFATSTMGPGSRVIALVRGNTGSSDYILLQIDERGLVGAEVAIGENLVHLESSSPHADGQTHHVNLQRSQGQLILKVDDFVSRIPVNSSLSMEPPSALVLGGVGKDSVQFLDYGNFTGDIINVFFASDLLASVNARPLDVRDGADDGNSGVESEGLLAAATHNLHGISSGALYRTAAMSGMGARDAFEDGSSAWSGSGSGVKFPTWDPGEASTVILAGGKEKEEEDDEEEEGINPVIAFVIGGMVLVVFVIVMVIIIVRAHFRKKGSFRPVEETHKDEEQGLLGTHPNGQPTSPVKEAMPASKLRQGPWKKSSKGNLTEEETPMLAEAVPLCTFTPAMEDVPMIDDEASEDELYPTLQSPKGAKREAHALPLQTPPNFDPAAPGGEAQSWLDRQSEMNAPILDLSAPEEKSPPINEDAAILRHPERQTNPLTPTPVDEGPSEVWTESMVLDMMEKDELLSSDAEGSQSTLPSDQSPEQSTEAQAAAPTEDKTKDHPDSVVQAARTQPETPPGADAPDTTTATSEDATSAGQEQATATEGSIARPQSDGAEVSSSPEDGDSDDATREEDASETQDGDAAMSAPTYQDGFHDGEEFLDTIDEEPDEEARRCHSRRAAPPAPPTGADTASEDRLNAPPPRQDTTNTVPAAAAHNGKDCAPSLSPDHDLMGSVLTSPGMMDDSESDEDSMSIQVQAEVYAQQEANDQMDDAEKALSSAATLPLPSKTHTTEVSTENGGQGQTADADKHTAPNSSAVHSSSPNDDISSDPIVADDGKSKEGSMEADRVTNQNSNTLQEESGH